MLSFFGKHIYSSFRFARTPSELLVRYRVLTRTFSGNSYMYLNSRLVILLFRENQYRATRLPQLLLRKWEHGSERTMGTYCNGIFSVIVCSHHCQETAVDSFPRSISTNLNAFSLFSRKTTRQLKQKLSWVVFCTWLYTCTCRMVAYGSVNWLSVHSCEEISGFISFYYSCLSEHWLHVHICTLS